MPATKPIPKKMREEMAEDPFYHRCCLSNGECYGRIQWHHHLRYAGQRQNVKFAILPVCEFHHTNEGRPDIKDRLDRVMILRSTPADLAKYPRKDWFHLKKHLGI